jgi:hypothetical protein
METENIEVIIHSKRLNPENGLILEIKDNKAKYYDSNSKEIKEAELKEKEIEQFLYFIEECGFYNLKNSYGANLKIESGFDIPADSFIHVKTNDKEKTVSAIFCGSLTPGAFNSLIWEALTLNKLKSGHSFFGK